MSMRNDTTIQHSSLISDILFIDTNSGIKYSQVYFIFHFITLSFFHFNHEERGTEIQLEMYLVRKSARHY